MSDVNPPTVEAKILIGYVILGAGQIKFYMGNIKQGGHDYNVHKVKINTFLAKARAFFCPCTVNRTEHFDQRIQCESQRFFILSRKQLVADHQLKYK